MKLTKCCICGKEFTGHGNNPDPVEKFGRCCNDCHFNVVVPRRMLDAKKAAARAAADAIKSTPLQKHESAKLNEFVGQLVRIVFWDDDVDWGTLHKDTLATYLQCPDSENTKIIGYYIDRKPRGELHFRKSRVKEITRAYVLQIDGLKLPTSTDVEIKGGKADAPIKTVYIPARAEHDGAHGINVKLRWVCPICGAPRGEISNGRSYDGSRVLFCNTWQNPCGHVDKYDDVRAEAAANGLNGDVFAGGGGTK